MLFMTNIKKTRNELFIYIALIEVRARPVSFRFILLHETRRDETGDKTKTMWLALGL
jgi:hypothetical protein